MNLIKRYLFIPCALSYFLSTGSPVFKESEVVIHLSNGSLLGVLTVPNKPDYALAIIVAGSGPTDRNGNSMFTQTNNLKKMSDSLVKNGIATFRYDKRGVGKSTSASFREELQTLDSLVVDLVRWCTYHRQNTKVNRIFILGHSEGSLIGILAAQQTKIEGFVSIDGIGNSPDVLLKKQLIQLPSTSKQTAFNIIDSLKANKRVQNVPLNLMFLFRPSVQTYWSSSFKYAPNKELKKLSCPSLIIHGKRDQQVDVQEAYTLIGGSKHSSLVLIDGMNHMLFDESLEKFSSEVLSKSLVTAIITFIVSG